MRRIALIAACLASASVAACGGTSPPASAPAAASPPTTTAEAKTPATTGDAQPLTEDECAQMIGHIVDLGVESRRRAQAPDEVPTPEQVAEIKAQMTRTMTPECLQFDRVSWRCAMDATTDEALGACVEPAP